jgi:hypothetical protein
MTKKRKRPVPKRAAKPKLSNASRAQTVNVLNKHAERLRKSGAHAMSIKPKALGHVIEVYVPEDFTGTLPSKVSATVKGKKVDVAIEVKKTQRFKPE